MNRGVGAGGDLIAEGVVGWPGEGVVRLRGGTWAGQAGGNWAASAPGWASPPKQRRVNSGQGKWEAGSGKRDEGRRTKDEGGRRGKGGNSHYEAVILCGIGLTGGGGWGKVGFCVFVC